MSRNRVYYGEYSLKHWVDLIIRGNIILPKYQRTFVWDKSKVLKLFASLKDDLFIPPVTIGHIKKDNVVTNEIIDGQQRLTSLLLGCLDIYPKLDVFANHEIERFANDNDDIEDDEDEPVLGWTINTLLSQKVYSSLDSLKKYCSSIEESPYEILGLTNTIKLDEDFLETHYLGFSFLVPDESSSQKYFSNTFKSINTAASSLTPLESRQSMYYLEEGAEKFFDPALCRRILVSNGSKSERIDFVRYLSMAFQLKQTGNTDAVLKNYGRKYEDYYSDFIISVIGGDSGNRFAQCDESNKMRIKQLEEVIEELRIVNRSFTSIIDADLYIFGLVYYIIVEKKDLDLSDKNNLTDKLESCINNLRRDEKHKKSPNTLKYLRMRLKESREIYSEYVK